MPAAYEDSRSRCSWCLKDPLYVRYHDEEWGVPLHDDRRLFEFLILEGMQAGLSWFTILRRRENYRNAFADFDATQVASFTEEDEERLLQDPGIIRNRLKVKAAVRNARAFLEVQAKFGSFAKYMWDFVDGKPVVNHLEDLSAIPATSALSDRISVDLKRRGFSFVGSTIVYAHLQATGVVNDHLISCFRYLEVQQVGTLSPTA